MTPKLFQIFRAGTFTAMKGQTVTFSEADLHGMAAAFNHKVRPAPLVLGHPENDKPEYGNVTGLLVRQGKLYAQANVSDALLQLVRAGRYGPVSASFLAPGSKDNPVQGAAYYLRHVGFLGAMPPAVKGLQPPSFAEHSGALCFSEVEAPFAVKPITASSKQSLNYDPDLLVVHQLALEYQAVCPSLCYSEAVTYAFGAVEF